MGYLAHFVIADEAAGQAIADSTDPLRTWRGFDSGDVNERHMASLFSQLRGYQSDEDLERADDELRDGYFESHTDPTTFTMRLSQPFADLLRNIDEAAKTRVAHQWASHQDLEGLDPEEVASCLARLRDLAVEAHRTRMRIMLWMGE